MLKLLAILAVLVAGGVFVARAATSPSAAPTAVAVAATPAPTRSGDTVVTVDESQVADLLNQNLAGKPLGDTPLGPATARDFGVQLRNGQVMVTGNAQVAGASAPMSMVGTVAAQNDRAVVSVTQATLGSVALPDASRQRIQDSLQAQVDQVVASRNVRLHSVNIADGKMTLAGTRG